MERSYRIEIRGRLPGSLAEELPQMALEVEGGVTSLTGPVPDGPALYGLIARLETLGVDLVAVHAQPESGPHHAHHRASPTGSPGTSSAIQPSRSSPGPHRGGAT